MTNLAKYESGGLVLEARIEDGQAWITYEQTAELFGCTRENVIGHVHKILMDGELQQNRTCKQFLLVRTEGNRSVSREAWHLNQVMVLHVGYRVRSERGSEFRRWATSVLKGETQAIQRAPTAAEQALAMAQALVDNERRLAATERRVEALETTFAEREAKAQEIHELPAPAVSAPPKTCGQMTVEVVRAWGRANNADFNGGFNKLYRDVEYRIGIDLKARKRNKPKLRMMDVIDASGKSLEIYAIACELFRTEKAA